MAGRRCGWGMRHIVDSGFLLDETTVEVLGGSIVNFLHKTF
jgi:hypothetical protein